MNKENLLECGRIVNTHGVKGGLKIESWCDSNEIFCSLKTVFYMKKDEPIELKITKASVHKNHILAYADGVETMEQAELLKNRVLFADRADIPIDEDRVFIADIIGLDVIDNSNGNKLGVLKDVIENPSSDLFVVETDGGKEVLVPAVDEFINHIDDAVYLDLIPGLFDGE